jgi:hypothetical protein
VKKDSMVVIVGAGRRSGCADDDLATSAVLALRWTRRCHSLSELNERRIWGCQTLQQTRSQFPLFIVVFTRSMTSDLPAIHAHAATCPPSARELVLCAHGGALCYPYSERSAIQTYTPTQQAANDLLGTENISLMQSPNYIMIK